MNNLFLNLLSTNFLVEYIYETDTKQSNDFPFYLLDNKNDNSLQLLNVDSVSNILNNTRNKSVTSVNQVSGKYALLTPNKLGSVYNDFDPNITDTVDASITIPNEGVVYDSIRLHIISGFNFSSTNTGVLIKVKIQTKTGQKIVLLNGIYKEGDKTTNNPRPFLLGGRQYSNYVEFKIPSFKYLKDSFNPLTNGLSRTISNNTGFFTNELIDIELGFVGEPNTLDNQIYYIQNQTQSTSITSSDEFSEIGTVIEESEVGDYIEYYGTYNGSIFGNYMNNLNNQGLGNHIVIHKLQVIEQIPKIGTDKIFVGYYDPSTNIPNITDSLFLDRFDNGSYWVVTNTGIIPTLSIPVTEGDFIIKNILSPNSLDIVSQNDFDNYGLISDFIVTNELDFIQNDNFNEIQKFRPIIKNGSAAISYRINYTLQIFNVNTNNTIEKSGSFLSFAPNKYGNSLLKINPGSFNKIEVFNKKVVNVIENKKVTQNSKILDSDIYKRNVTSFKLSENIFLGANNVSIDNNGNITPGGSSNIVANLNGQGKCIIYLSPFDTFIKFKIFEENNGTVNSIDINNIGNIYLNFKTKSGELIKISSTNNPNIFGDKGEVLFNIKENDYNRIIENTKNVFYLTTKSGTNTPETLIYNGIYKDISQKISDSDILQRNSDLEKELSELKTNFEQIINQRVEYQLKNRTATQNEQLKPLNVRTNGFNPFGPTSGSVGTTSRNV